MMLYCKTVWWREGTESPPLLPNSSSRSFPLLRRSPSRKGGLFLTRYTGLVTGCCFCASLFTHLHQFLLLKGGAIFSPTKKTPGDGNSAPRNSNKHSAWAPYRCPSRLLPSKRSLQPDLGRSKSISALKKQPGILLADPVIL